MPSRMRLSLPGVLGPDPSPKCLYSIILIIACVHVLLILADIMITKETKKVTLSTPQHVVLLQKC